MNQLVKGSHAPRISVVCSKCGVTFERSAVHPYIVDCPNCRSGTIQVKKAGAKVTKRIKCKLCRSFLDTEGGLGMHVCKYCGEQWWTMPGGIWRNWSTGDVFKGQALYGNINEEGIREILDRIRLSVI